LHRPRLTRAAACPALASRLGLLAILLAHAACGPRTGDESKPNAKPASKNADQRHLSAVISSVVVAGGPTELVVLPLDDIGRPLDGWRGALTATSDAPSFQAPLTFAANDSGALVLRPVTFFSPGVHRVTVRSAEGLVAVAGPVLVVASEERLRPRAGADALRLRWGDAHGHSDVGDGLNSPESYFFYAREIARLDFTCLSEHDFQQFLEVGLDQDSTGWDRIAGLARTWRRPGFAAIVGWEWSSREWGHRVVLFPRDTDRWVSYRKVATPAELARAVAGTGAISVLAHPKGSELTPPIAWDAVVPGFDVAVEVYSGHGGMDDDDSFRPTSNATPRSSAMQAIARGLPLAFVAFSDTHLSSPGNPFAPPIRDAPYAGGLTAVWSAETTEPAIVDAIRAGRTYATSGERFLVDVRIGGCILGESAALQRGERIPVRGVVAAVHSLERVELMRGLDVAAAVPARGKPEIELSLDVGPFEGPSTLWLRGESSDGERFWTTPVRIDER
jgi:hypothetical protein